MKVLFNLAWIAAALALSGCAQLGYNLGSMLPPEIKTVYIPTVINESDQPGLEAEVTRALQEAIQLDGSLELADEANADSILLAKVTSYDLVPIAYRDDKATATEEYRVFLTAAFAVQRTSDGSFIAQSARVRGESTFLLEGDLTSAKRNALPEAARDLAHDIVEQVVEYW